MTGGSNASRVVSGVGGSSGIDPVLLENFRILRRPVQAADHLPAVFVRSAERMAAVARMTVSGSRGPGMLAARRANLGLLPSLTRRTTLPGTRLERWLEPGRRGFCVWTAERGPSGAPITGGFGGGCAATTTRLWADTDGGAFLAAGPPLVPGSRGEPALAMGLLPDRVSAVDVVTPGGVATRLQLADGFFATRFSAGDRLYAIVAGRRKPIDVA